MLGRTDSGSKLVEAHPRVGLALGLRIVSVTFPITFMIGVLDGISPYFGLYLVSVRGMHGIEVGAYESFLAVIRYALTPVALFSVSYFMGKGLDVRDSLRAIAGCILLSGFVGSSIGQGLGYSIMAGLVQAPTDLLFTVVSSMFNGLLSAVALFFVSFSAVAIASVRKRGAKPSSP